MKRMKMSLWAILQIVIVIFSLTAGHAFADEDRTQTKAEQANGTSSPIELNSWAIFWEMEDTTLPIEDILNQKEGWTTVSTDGNAPSLPEGVDSAWIRISLPELQYHQPSLFIQKIYANTIEVYDEEGTYIFSTDRERSTDHQYFLIPLDTHETLKNGNHQLYLHLETIWDRIGIRETMYIGEYNEQLTQFVRKGLMEFVIGSALIVVALVMMLGSIFLRRMHVPSWFSLTLIILSIGIMLVAYSEFLRIFAPETKRLHILAFDIAMTLMLPAMIYYFEKVVTIGPWGIIRKYRKLLVYYCTFLIFLALYNFIIGMSFDVYFFLSVTFLSFFIIIEFALLVVFALINAFRKDLDAIIYTIGFVIFALIFIGEMVWFLVQDINYDFIYWKWGVLAFILALIMILARRIAADHDRVVRYTKELEMYNRELQHAEKMEMISELAASVAHEVRNPLQVTRGFIQLQGENKSEKEKRYLNLAIQELDRASDIITDFLTFAKPQMESIAPISLDKELKHIVGILSPLASINNGTLVMEVRTGLTIMGNSAKFKQAIINMVKNSIEALEEKGEVRLHAYAKNDEIYLHIKDTGVGMEAEEIEKLGQPYYSNKTKGTGLGLMVTYRIIQSMKGSLTFSSVKGEGTEAILRFPTADNYDQVEMPKEYE
ncbi:ATP-binding protein [Marinicrinis sediminis]|uniref:histidine kinase n=1 Tax=Marinicrinis sediminis TaxID=1652465 RepID=A0ABW5RDZ8_9BACL